MVWYQLLFGHGTAKGLQQQEEEQQQHLQSCSCSTAVSAAEVLELNMTYCWYSKSSNHQLAEWKTLLNFWCINRYRLAGVCTSVEASIEDLPFGTIQVPMNLWHSAWFFETLITCGKRWFNEALRHFRVICSNKWMFPKIGVPQNGWFIMKNPIKMGIKMDDLRVPLFLETPK